MVVEFAKGQAQEFVATRDFALNFEDRNIPSVKVREGETVQYDGQVAIYTKADGDLAKGRCPGLKSAINMMHWLELVEKEAVAEALDITSEGVPELTIEVPPKVVEGNLFEEETPSQAEVVIPPQEGEEYDNLKGGSFETYAHKGSEIHVVGKRGFEVIKEEDRIVKKFPPVKETEAKKKGGKLEVAGDQVEVKLVTSSTVTPRAMPKRKFEVVEGEQFGADSSLPMKSKKASSNEPQQKSTYRVDDSTPRATEGMSRDEIQRITKPKVINADESQNAKIVKKINLDKMEVKEIEGITLRKTESPKEMSFKKTTSPDGLTIKTKVGSGSTPVADISQQGVVVAKVEGVKKSKTSVIEPQEAVEVAKIGQSEAPPKPIETDEKTGDDLIADIFEEKPEETKVEKEKKAVSDKKAKERASSRKKSSAQTQKAMESSKNIPTLKVDLDKEQGPSKSGKTIVTKPKKTGKTEGGTDYLLMLPDDWGKLHWVKKEKFIKGLTDIAFIKFIQSVETIKAVQNACTERLKELEQTG